MALSEFREMPFSISTMDQSSNGISKLNKRQKEMLEMRRSVRINQNYFRVDGNNLEMIEKLSED